MSEQPSDDLEAAVAQLHKRVDKLENEQQRTKLLFEQFQEGEISRRAFLAAVGGAAGIGALASNARAAPSWGSASGELGTQSAPLNKVISQDVRAQSVDTEQISGGGSPISLTDALSRTVSSGTDKIYTTGGGNKTEVIQEETSVPDTSETAILADPDGFSIYGLALVQVDSGSGNRATDLVLANTGSGDITTVASVTQKSPPTRTYGSDSDDRLTISVGSGSADVTAWGVNQFA